MELYSPSLRVIGDDIFYIGVKVATLSTDQSHVVLIDKFKRMIQEERVRQVECVTYCDFCEEEYLDEE